MNMTKSVVKVLSIDGGGIRGVIPIIILKEIQNRLKAKNKVRPFYEIFDLISGTSTGGLIATVLTTPANKQINSSLKYGFDINNLLKFYKDKCPTIFHQTKLDKIKFLKQAFTPKYNPKPFEKILNDILGDYTLKDALTNLLIPAFNMTSMEPFFFKKRPFYSGGNEDTNFYMKDVARATSAVPTYFPPANIKSITNNKKYCFVDGGVFASNPSLCAYIESYKIYPNAEKYIMVSIGTGEITKRYSCKQVSNWGYIGWIAPWNDIPLLNTMMKGESRCANHMLKKLPHVNLYRLNISINELNKDMDNTSKTNLKALIKATNIYINNHPYIFEQLSSIL